MKRTLALGLLVALLGAVSGNALAGDELYKTVTLSWDTVGYDPASGPIGIAGYKTFWMVVQPTVPDTADADSCNFLIQERLEDGSDWRTIFTSSERTTDSANAAWPLRVKFDAHVDTLIYAPQIRFVLNTNTDTVTANNGDSTGGAKIKVSLKAQKQ